MNLKIEFNSPGGYYLKSTKKIGEKLLNMHILLYFFTIDYYSIHFEKAFILVKTFCGQVNNK